MFQLCFNFNKIHDSVGKASRTANQARVTLMHSHSRFIQASGINHHLLPVMLIETHHPERPGLKTIPRLFTKQSVC
jgi:hypothetical protein